MWQLLPWVVIIFLLLTHRAGAATIPATYKESDKSSSNGGLSSLMIKPTPSTTLIKQIQDAQKPPAPPPVVSPVPAPEPVVEAPVSFSNSYDWGNCTWAVASWVNVPDNMGNAANWANAAQQDGYTVSSIPKVGSVAQTSAGYFGHVALVEDAQGNQVLIKEANVQGLGVIDERWVDSGQFNYIYF